RGSIDIGSLSPHAGDSARRVALPVLLQAQFQAVSNAACRRGHGVCSVVSALMDSATVTHTPISSSRATDVARTLAKFNAARLTPALPTDDWQQRLSGEQHLLRLEGEFVEAQRAAVARRAREAPRDADDFLNWFETLEE